MNINSLVNLINKLNEEQKAKLFEKILYSELEKIMTKENIRDKGKFIKQFNLELTQEITAKHNSMNFNPAV